MTTTAPAIELADLRKTFTVRGETVTAVDGLDLTVQPGEVVAVLGPNGAGKTTMLSILAAQLHPTSGEVTLLDETLGLVDVFELRPRIGITSASIADRIPKGEAVRDVVISASYSVLGRWRENYDPMDVARAEELMCQMRIDHLAGRTFGTLSEGERKRVQIARALMTDPEILLLDEPAAGLDLTGREALVATLSEICTDPASPATVLVTHHVEEIPEGITHALLLRQGDIVAAGPVDQVLTSELMSDTFGIDLDITHTDGRWAARAKRTPRS